MHFYNVGAKLEAQHFFSIRADEINKWVLGSTGTMDGGKVYIFQLTTREQHENQLIPFQSWTRGP